MARTDRFVKAADKDGKTIVTRLPLTDGDWIEVKQRLSIGELQTIEQASYRSFHQARTTSPEAPRLEVDLEAFGLVRNFTWLVDWSLRDADDKSVPVTIQAVAALDPETFTEIEDAISAHVERIAAAKKAKASAKTASPTPNGSTTP